MKIEIFVNTTLLKSRCAFYKIVLIFEATSQPIHTIYVLYLIL